MKFKVTVENSKGETIFIDVTGERIRIAGIDCFVFADTYKAEDLVIYIWNVSHLETGLKVFSDPDRERAISIATDLLTQQPDAINKGIAICKQLNIELPVNK